MRSTLLATALLLGSSVTARADAPGDTAAPPTPTPATSLAPVASGEQAPIQVGPDPSARTPAIVATVATGALIVATIAIYEHRESLAKLNTLDTPSGPCDVTCLAERQAEKDDRSRAIDRYKKAYIGTAVGAIVAGGIAGYLWTKATEKTFVRPPRMTLNVDPAGGATLAFDGRF